MQSSFRPWPYSKLALHKTHRDISSAASSTPLFIFIPPHGMLSHNHRPPTPSACLLGNYIHTEVTVFCPCYSKCGCRSSNISITWGLIRHKELTSRPRPTESVCIVTRSPGDSQTCWSLRSTALYHGTPSPWPWLIYTRDESLSQKHVPTGWQAVCEVSGMSFVQ